MATIYEITVGDDGSVSVAVETQAQEDAEHQQSGEQPEGQPMESLQDAFAWIEQQEGGGEEAADAGQGDQEAMDAGFKSARGGV